MSTYRTERATLSRSWLGLLPGVSVCMFVVFGSFAAASLEQRLLQNAWLEPLVIAIVLGTIVRTFWSYGARCERGIVFCAKTLLEIAVVLIGASVSASALIATGWHLITGITVLVALAIIGSYGIGRSLGLSQRMALLIACGNAICGNSAIAAVAPVIEADSKDVAGAIAFTAVLGVVVVLGLPVLGAALALDPVRYGALSGLTIYAVPQVLAATAPFGQSAMQIGTLVKLFRVLMLGPVCLALALFGPSLLADRTVTGNYVARRARPPFHKLVPSFIIGFICLMALRSAGGIPLALLPAIGKLAGFLTVVSMAALGLGVDIRTVARVGPRITSTVVLSLAALILMSIALIHLANVR